MPKTPAIKINKKPVPGKRKENPGYPYALSTPYSLFFIPFLPQ
jgi:hypothetical protein